MIMKTLQITEDKIKDKVFSSGTLPEQSAQSLFHCVSKLEYLLKLIEKSSISARYCREDIEYLSIDYDKIAYPMICFCDIPLHKLHQHIRWYGKYAIAFSKEWGLKKGLQPVTYINEGAEILKYFRGAFKKAQTEDLEHFDSEGYQNARDFLFSSMSYYKPMWGKTKDIYGEEKERWLTDDCEWRYIGTFQKAEAPNAIIEPELLTDIAIKKVNSALENVRNTAQLSFNYEDIQYIIVSTQADFNELISLVEKLDYFKGKRFSTPRS